MAELWASVHRDVERTYFIRGQVSDEDLPVRRAQMQRALFVHAVLHAGVRCQAVSCSAVLLRVLQYTASCSAVRLRVLQCVCLHLRVYALLLMLLLVVLSAGWLRARNE